MNVENDQRIEAIRHVAANIRKLTGRSGAVNWQLVADDFDYLLARLEEVGIEQRLIGHGDGQVHTVEEIASFVEHLRDEYQSSMEPVTKVARLIRERFASLPAEE